MIEIPAHKEVLHIAKGSKASFEYVLQDENYNEIDITGDTFTCKVVDSEGNEQADACVVNIEDNHAILTIDTTNLNTDVIYTCEMEDTTLAMAIARIEIHVEKSVIHGG